MKGTVSSTQPVAHLIFPSNVISSWVTQDSKAIAAQLEEELHNLPNSTALDIIITIIDEIIIQQGQLEGLAFTICNYVDAKQLWSCHFSSNDDFVKSIPKLAGILDSSTLQLPHLLGMTRSYLDKVSPLLFTVCELIASVHYNQKQFCSSSYSQERKFNTFPLYLLLMLLKSQLPSYLHMIIT